MSSNPVYVALDTDDLDRAKSLAKTVGPVTGGLKLGMEFINTFGPQGIEAVKNACPDAALFIDLKFHDIPNTVAKAVKTVSENFNPAYLNVHAAGGLEMMQRARSACAKGTSLLAVTILTSLDIKALKSIGYKGDDVSESVVRLAQLTEKAGLDGVVCSAHEIELLRHACKKDFKLMVPGIRPAGAAKGDQVRVMTPKQAIERGATHLVIGRPITQAADPAKAAADILAEL